MTDEMYARIREIADEHGGKLDVTVSHPDLPTPVIAHPQPGTRLWRDHRSSIPRPPEVYMTEDDLNEFRERIRAEGLRPQRQSEDPLDDIFPTVTPFPDAVQGTAEPSGNSCSILRHVEG